MNCKTAVTTCLLISGMFAALAGNAPEGKGIAWIEDWGAALEQARTSNKLLMVDFYTSWCTFCKNLDNEAFVDPRVVALSKDFVCTKLDADVAKAAAMRYEPDGYPTIVFGSSSGDEIIRISGYRTTEEIFKVMKTVHETGPKISENLAIIDEDRKNFAANESLGSIYLELGLPDKALPYLKRALKVAPGAQSGGGTEAPKARVMFTMARAYFAAEDYRKAARMLEDLLEEHLSSPQCAEYAALLERAYTECGKPDRAADAKSKCPSQSASILSP
ncbi:MAG: thioredoxin family protein [Acidobacteriota bacterium]|nr:MAG: thioredoxin family protein [Acidobacteriota bacterium]